MPATCSTNWALMVPEAVASIREVAFWKPFAETVTRYRPMGSASEKLPRASLTVVNGVAPSAEALTRAPTIGAPLLSMAEPRSVNPAVAACSKFGNAPTTAAGRSSKTERNSERIASNSICYARRPVSASAGAGMSTCSGEGDHPKLRMVSISRDSLMPTKLVVNQKMRQVSILASIRRSVSARVLASRLPWVPTRA